MMLTTETFRPAPYLRKGHLQTILASSSFRAWGRNPMCDAAREVVVATSGGVRLLQKYSDFNSASEYFSEYSLLKYSIKDLPVPNSIITAKDDPIIPVEDFYQLELNHRTNLIIQAFGGHNGFIDGFFLKSWYEQKLADIFDEIVQKLEGQEAVKLLCKML
jgi:predicted alpha/beta-fold hydrolase